MSFKFFAPHHRGLIIRQDRTTGALVGPVWAGDEVTDLQLGSPGQVATHPLQSGRVGPTDARIAQPRTISASMRISARGSLTHPRPDWIGPFRVQQALDELRQIVDEGQPIACLFRGGDLLRDYVIESPTISLPLGSAEALISLTMVHVRVVTLRTVPVEQDADLLSLGSQVAASIGVFG